jgi:hypothetical protein
MSLKEQTITNAQRLDIRVPRNPTLKDFGDAMLPGQEAIIHGIQLAPPIAPTYSPAVFVTQAPVGLASGTIEGAVEHILDELAYHGFSNDDFVQIAVALAQAALNDAMNEAPGSNQLDKYLSCQESL